jgi:hypothetical protein
MPTTVTSPCFASACCSDASKEEVPTVVGGPTFPVPRKPYGVYACNTLRQGSKNISCALDPIRNTCSAGAIQIARLTRSHPSHLALACHTCRRLLKTLTLRPYYFYSFRIMTQQPIIYQTSRSHVPAFTLLRVMYIVISFHILAIE